MFTSGSGLWLNLSHKDKGAIFSGEKRIKKPLSGPFFMVAQHNKEKIPVIN